MSFLFKYFVEIVNNAKNNAAKKGKIIYKLNILIVGLNSHESVKKLKGDDRPINTFEDRAMLLSSLRFVDLVIIFEEQTPENLIKEIKPDILVKGGDYDPKDIIGYKTVIENGGQVKVLGFHDGYSSSNYINKIKKH